MVSRLTSEHRISAMPLSATTTSIQTLVVVLLMVIKFIDTKPFVVHCGTNEYLAQLPSSTFLSVEDATSVSKESVRGRLAQAAVVGLRCLPCSTCPNTQIVRRPCSRLSDTVCGPLYDFEFFNNPPHTIHVPTSSHQHKTPASDAVGGDSNGRHRLLRLRGWRPHQSQAPGEYQAPGDRNATDGATDAAVGSATPATKEPSRLFQCFSDEWSVICYGVVGGVPIVLTCIICIALFVCYRSCWFARQKPHLFVGTDTIFPRNRPLLVVHQNENSAQVHHVASPASATAVDRRVRHLETQLRRQRQQRDGQRGQGRDYGDAASGRRGTTRVCNDYVDFRSWFRMIRGSGCAVMATAVTVSESGTLETAPLHGIRSTTAAVQLGEIV